MSNLASRSDVFDIIDHSDIVRRRECELKRLEVDKRLDKVNMELAKGSVERKHILAEQREIKGMLGDYLLKNEIKKAVVRHKGKISTVLLGLLTTLLGYLGFKVS